MEVHALVWVILYLPLTLTPRLGSVPSWALSGIFTLGLILACVLACVPFAVTILNFLWNLRLLCQLLCCCYQFMRHTRPMTHLCQLDPRIHVVVNAAPSIVVPDTVGVLSPCFTTGMGEEPPSL